MEKVGVEGEETTPFPSSVVVITRRVSCIWDSTSASAPAPSHHHHNLCTTMSDKDMLISMGFDPARVECTFE